MRTGAEAAEITASLLGAPFKHLPGNPPEHQMLGRCSDGTLIRVGAVEIVMNDAWLVDSAHGAGTYAADFSGSGDVRQLEVLATAVQIYGCDPIDLHKAGRG